MAPSSHRGPPLQATHQHRRTARHVKVDRVRLPPAAVRKARNPQNFLPFPRRKKEEALAFCHLLRLFLDNGFSDSPIVEDFRGPHPRLLQDVSWEEFGGRKSSIAEVHEGLERDRVLHLRQHCITPRKDDISPQGRGYLAHQELTSVASQAEMAHETVITGGLESQGLHGKGSPVHLGGGLNN